MIEPAARDDAGEPVRRHRDEGQAHAGMDGEVVDALFRLFDQGVAVDLPGELLGLAVHLFQRLVERDGADRDRAVPDDPFARLVDMLAGREVHDRVAAPADGPGHLLDLLADRRCDGRVADVGVDLHEEVAADDHRLGFRVVDVGRQDGAPAGDFVAHEFGRDPRRDRGAEGLARMLAAQQRRHAFAGRAGGFQGAQVFLAPQVFADGGELHLGRHDALARVVHLGDVAPAGGAARLALQVEAQRGQRRILQTLPAVGGGRAGQFDGVAALADPLAARAGQAGADVDAHFGVGVRSGGVVDPDRRIRFMPERGGRGDWWISRIGTRMSGREPAT
jgi:hypothetical protein